MQDPQDREPFTLAMKRLLTSQSITPTAERVAVYWDALCDLSLESVAHACQHAARYWLPTPEEHLLPRPATLREYARAYTVEQRQRLATAQRQALPQWSETPDEVGLEAIRKILDRLSTSLDMTQPRRPVRPVEDDDERQRLIDAGQLNPPDPKRWLPLTEEL